MPATSLPLSLLVGAPLLLLPGAVVAGEPERVVFSYSAPPGCPSESEFVSRVEAMGARIARASPGERTRHFDVLIAKTPTSFSGTLTVAAPGGGAHMRSVQCGRCESVAEALALVTAMSLTDGPRAEVAAADPGDAIHSGADAPAASSPPEPRQPDPPPTNVDGDASGGLAVLGSWDFQSWTPSGVEVIAAAAGGTHLGMAASLTSVSLTDVRHPGGGQATLGIGQGYAVRLGAVASWGAPWGTDEVFGFVLQAGLRASMLQGAKWNLSPSGQDCESQWGGDGSGFSSTPVPDCRTGPGAATTWLSLSPYVAGSIVVQVAPKDAVRPFVGATFVWSGNDLGDSGTYLTLDAGLSWRAW